MLAALVTVTRTGDGSLQVSLGAEAHLDSAATPAGRLEVSATLVTITLGPAPAAVALPDLAVSARIGHATIATPADLLVNLTAPEVIQLGSVRLGFTLDPQRRPALVLAAHDVVVGSHPYPVLDLTNPQTLADVAGSAVGDLADAVLGRLGTAADLVTVLLGVTAPTLGAADPPWTVPLTGLPALLANPVNAFLGYHRAVLDAGRYIALLEPLRALLRAAAVNVGVTGDGTVAVPWRLTLDDGVALLVWASGSEPAHLHLALGVDHAVTDLGGGCPTVRFEAHADLVDVALDGLTAHVLPGLHAGLVLGARAGVPLQLGDTQTALVADTVGVALNWSPGGSLTAGLVAPGLAATIDGESVPFSLPTIQPDGSLSPDIPWRALELLAGHALTRTGLTWAADLADLTGWLPRTALTGPVSGSGESDLPLEGLLTDPVPALTGWVSDLVASGRLAVLAHRVAMLLTGETVSGIPAGVLTGHGTARSPFALPLVGSQVDAALRAEVLLWGRDLEPAVDAFRPGSLFAALDPGGTPASGAALASALLDAAAHSADLRDTLLGRDELAAGLDGLLARWVGTDGLVRGSDAVLPGATLIDVVDTPAAGLVAIDLGALTGVPLGEGTLVAAGPLGPTAWPGIAADHVLDWTAAGLAPDAFDDATLRTGTGTGTGPWLVLLPSRAAAVVTAGDDGAARQADRLARAVTALTAGLTASGSVSQVSLVGVGAAGHTAVNVAARGGVAALITVGTPHAGISLDVLEVQPVAGTIALLSALLPPVQDAEVPAVTLGRGLLGALTSAYDAATSPVADLAPPAAVPALPVNLPVWCVRGVLTTESAGSALAGLVVRALQESYERQVNGDSDPASADDGVLHLGLAVTVAPPSSAGELSIRTTAALTREAFSGTAAPGLRLRVEVGRTGGWLAGGPDPTRPADVARHPSVRRATLEVDLAHGGEASARVVLHETEVFGVARARWMLSHSDDVADPLVPEALVALSRVATALAASGSAPVTQLTGLLSALGLTEPGGSFAFSANGMRRLLVNPAGLLAEVTGGANAATLAGAICTLLGAAAPPPPPPPRSG